MKPLHRNDVFGRAGLLFSLSILAAFGPPAAAQQPAPPVADPPSVENRLQGLEKRNRELEERLQTLEGKGSPGKDGAGASSAGGDAESLDGLSLDYEEIGQGLTVRYGNVRTTFQFFGDVDFRFQNPKPVDRANSSFAFGSLDFFATAQLGDHFQVLSETLLEGGENEIGLDQERLWGKWTFHDFLYAKLGVEHTMISHWNRVFHHGKWLQTPIERPVLARFEDDEGILPMHETGLELGGSVSTGAGKIEYSGAISNGRGITPEDRQNLYDRNDAKAFDVQIGYMPAFLHGLHIGGAFRADDLPGDPDPTVGRPLSTRQLIGSAFLDYRQHNWEALAEFAFIGDKDRGSASTFNHRSGYLQVGYRVKELDLWGFKPDFTPYCRIDFRAMERGDPFYAVEDRDLDKWEQIFGIRCELTSNSALKVEIGFGKEERRIGASDISQEIFITVAAQMAWVF